MSSEIDDILKEINDKQKDILNLNVKLEELKKEKLDFCFKDINFFVKAIEEVYDRTQLEEEAKLFNKLESSTSYFFRDIKNSDNKFKKLKEIYEKKYTKK